MEENLNNATPEPQAPPVSPVAPWQAGYCPPPAPPKITFPMGRTELFFALGILAFSLLLSNSMLYYGLNLGAGIGLMGLMGCTFFYLLRCGHKPDRYSAAILILSAAIIAAFPRSDDAGLKMLMVCLLMTFPALAFCLTAGQNLRKSDGITSLLDSPRAQFVFGFGRMAESARGIKKACSATDAIGKTGGAVILGLVCAVPLVAILIPLLMSADAAFEGLLDLLPETKWERVFFTALWGVGLAWVLYTRGVALQYLAKKESAPAARKGLNPITVNTVLIAVTLVYLAYLASQLAYFVGGFSGILPEEFTMAEYARRGFFEMAWLCTINLGVMALAMGLVTAKGKAPLLTKLLCLFLGLVTLFLVFSASAKMVLYIGSYGLTRLRVLTEVFMVWLGLTTVVVCVWLFRPRTAYMKYAVVLGLAFCACLMWADVDAQVARYNVRAYQSGQLETIDIWHLRTLNNSAIPYLEELTKDPDEAVAEKARKALKDCRISGETDIRSWNYPESAAREIVEKYDQPKTSETSALITP